MECYYHPSRESTDVCAICGKSICKECGLEIAGKVYCKDCLEKIVGLSMDNTPKQEPDPEPTPEPAPEPVRLEKPESPESKIEMANLTRQPEEVQFSNQKIADDSPYKINDNIQYEGNVESTYDDNYQPKVSLHEAIESNQVPKEPVQDVRQEYVQQEPVLGARQEYVQQDPMMQEVVRQPASQARNEYDYVQQRPQAPPADDYIYPDHSYQPQETSARREVEDKYERYLDDLYFDEEEVPLNEQLARDEAQYGSITRHEYQPRNAHQEQQAADDDLDRRIREELARREHSKSKQHKGESFHNINYEGEKEPYSALDIVLTIVLILVIIIVLFYILYIFKLSATYPTFIDAIYGLRNPGLMINTLTH